MNISIIKKSNNKKGIIIVNTPLIPLLCFSVDDINEKYYGDDNNNVKIYFNILQFLQYISFERYTFQVLEAENITDAWVIHVVFEY